MLNKHVKL